jgi:hypothetical protein
MRGILVALCAGFVLTAAAFAQAPDAAPPPAPVSVAASAPSAPPAASAEAAAAIREDFVVDAIVARASDKMQQRQDYYWGIAAAVGAVFIGLFTFIGLGQMADIRKTTREAVLQDLRNDLAANTAFQESVAAKIRSSLLEEMREQTDRLGRDMKYVRLQVLSERVASNDQVDENDRAALRDDLLSLAGHADIVATPAYRVALRNATDFFFRRGASQEMDLLDDLLGDVICADRDNLRPMITMMQHYGLRVIGSKDEVEPGPDTIARFMKYANGLKRNGYFEESAHYVIALEMMMKQPGWEGRVDAVWRDVEHFSTHEKSELYNSIQYCSVVERLSDNPRPHHFRIVHAFTQLAERYAAHITPLQGAYQERQAERESAS